MEKLGEPDEEEPTPVAVGVACADGPAEAAANEA